MLWVGDMLPLMMKKCIQSFIDQKHPVHLYTYDNIKNCSEDVTFMDANSILNESLIFRCKNKAHNNSIAPFADFFRWKLLYEKGGWWTDTDVYCIRPFIFEKEYVFASVPTGINNHVIKVPPKSPLMLSLYNTSAHIIKQKAPHIKYYELGFRLLRRFINDFNLHKYVCDDSVFGPYRVKKLFKIIRGGGRPPLSNKCHSIHFGSDSYRKDNLDLNVDYALYKKMARETVIDKSDNGAIKTTFAIKTFMRPNALQACINAIHKHVHPHSYLIYVADDSSDHVKLKNQKILKIDKYISLPFDTGVSAGRNSLISEVETPYVLLLDDDFIINKDIDLNILINILETQNIDMIGGRYNWRHKKTNASQNSTLMIKNNILYRLIDIPYAIDIQSGYPLFDFCEHFFISKTNKVKQHLWNPDFKVYGDHIAFFWDMKQSKNPLRITHIPYLMSACHERIYDNTSYNINRKNRFKNHLQKAAKYIGIFKIKEKFRNKKKYHNTKFALMTELLKKHEL